MQPPRLLALGDGAWTLEFGQTIDPDTHGRVMGLAQHLLQLLAAPPEPMQGVTDVVPTFRSLTVHYDPGSAQAHALGPWLLSLATEGVQHAEPTVRHWCLPVCFDDEWAPDLPRVAALTGLRREAVIERLLGTELRVYQIGFQPGFPYMGDLPSELAVPRWPSPRQTLPARSLAIAGGLCAVYPWKSPGGWNLLGRTPVVLFDPGQQQQPAMLAAGDTVRWMPIDRAMHDRLAADIAHGLPRSHFLARERA
ncbi:MAG: 5-oxoprolinase subunit PxpB [Hydrogenophaga sp.]